MAVQHGRGNRANADGPIQLHQFLRFIAGRAGVARDHPHASNDDLINNLRRMGVLTSCVPIPCSCQNRAAWIWCQTARSGSTCIRLGQRSLITAIQMGRSGRVATCIRLGRNSFVSAVSEGQMSAPSRPHQQSQEETSVKSTWRGIQSMGARSFCGTCWRF